MKNIIDFLDHLHDLDLRLWVEEGRLHCNGPTELLTEALQAELADRKKEIIAFFEEARVSALETTDAIKPVARDGDLPLSFAQQRLWFLEQMEGPSATYNIPTALRLDGPLQLTALESALDHIIVRHEILRTNFPSAGGTPRQNIAPALSLAIPVVDLSSLSSIQRDEALDRLTFQEAQQPFNLAEGPLLRIAILRLGTNAHALLLTMHHIITDGWSVDILIREWVTLYDFHRQTWEQKMAELAEPAPALGSA